MRPQFIDDPVRVQTAIQSDGETLPVAFVWRTRLYAIADHGRRWDEADAGVDWRCYLVRSPTGDTFELRCAADTGRWVLHRAWLQPDLLA